MQTSSLQASLSVFRDLVLPEFSWLTVLIWIFPLILALVVTSWTISTTKKVLVLSFRYLLYLFNVGAGNEPAV